MNKDIAPSAAKMLLETKSVLFNAKEPFKYTSGNIGPVYVDCRRPLSFPESRDTLMDLAVLALNQQISKRPFDLVAGAETAGIPYGALIADRLSKGFIYVRKQAKGHGRMSQIEGHFEPEQAPYTLLVEDLQNFGSSKKVFVDALRQAGATIEHFFVLFDYGIRPEVAKDNEQMNLTQHHLCNWWDVLAIAKQDSLFDSATLDSVEAYLNDPIAWVTNIQESA